MLHHLICADSLCTIIKSLVSGNQLLDGLFGNAWESYTSNEAQSETKSLEDPNTSRSTLSLTLAGGLGTKVNPKSFVP